MIKLNQILAKCQNPNYNINPTKSNHKLKLGLKWLWLCTTTTTTQHPGLPIQILAWGGQGSNGGGLASDLWQDQRDKKN